MKKLSALLAINLLLIAPSFAADAVVEDVAPVVVETGYNWSGFYVGVNGGYGWGDTNHYFTATSLSAGDWDVNGGLVGGTLGYNWQPFGSNWLLGVEADAAWSGIDGDGDRTGCNTGDCFTDMRAFGTARARVGAAFDNSLIFVTAGGAFANVDAGILNSNDNDSDNRFGWTVGAGFEYGFTNNWSAKAEYLYADFGDDVNYTIGGSVNPTEVDLTTNIVRVGLNYRFGQ